MSALPLVEQPTDCQMCRFFADHGGEPQRKVCVTCDLADLGPLRSLKNGTYRRTESHKLVRSNT